MRKLSKNQEYAIRWLMTQDRTLNQISEELDISIERVESVYRQHSENKQSKPTTSKTQDLMIRETSVKKSNNVAIMTKEASQYNDEIKKKVHANKKTKEKDLNSFIYKPN